MASDRAARVAAKIADRYTDYLPRDERYDLIDHVRSAIRRECKRAVEEAMVAAIRAAMHELVGSVTERRLTEVGHAIAAAIRARK